MLKNSIDVMVDLETLGVNAGCTILTIGACTFDQNNAFYAKICRIDSDRHGFIEEPDTLAWWAKQDPEVRREAFSGVDPVIKVLGAFSDWITGLPAKDVYIWGNGADFDIPLLKAYYEVCRMKTPWKPFNGRCYRTLKNLYSGIKGGPKVGHHHALADAKWQAAHAREILSQHFRKHEQYQD